MTTSNSISVLHDVSEFMFVIPMGIESRDYAMFMCAEFAKATRNNREDDRYFFGRNAFTTFSCVVRNGPSIRSMQ